MLTILRKLIDSSRGQRGQVLVMGVGVLIMSLGAIMISIDVGWWLRDKRDAQNDADAIALAAVQEIGNPANRPLAVAAGLDWADFNSVDVDAGEVATPDCLDGVLESNFCFIDQNSDGTDDMVRVKVSRPSISFIAEALGVGTPTLNPSAAAATVYVSGSCVMPWGIVGEKGEDLYGLDEGALYVFQNKEDFVEDSSGNFGAVSIYGEGACVYGDAIEGNCEPRNKACTSDPMVFVDETLLGCTSEPGTKGAVTDKHLDNRFPNSPSTDPPSACDAATFLQAQDRVENPDCLERLVPVAVINAFPSGGSNTDVDIYGIVNFYLAGWDKNKTCFTVDDVKQCGFVWGYLISSAPVNTAEVVFTRDFVAFAPTGVALVE